MQWTLLCELNVQSVDIATISPTRRQRISTSIEIAFTPASPAGLLFYIGSVRTPSPDIHMTIMPFACRLMVMLQWTTYTLLFLMA